MSSTFTCGELKKTKFILSSNVNMAGEKFNNLSKTGKDAEGEVYQIKPGANILKINSKDDLINLLEKNSDGKLKYRQIGKNGEVSVLAPISDKDYKEILENIKETYDGISIDKKALNELTKEERELLGAEEGIKILNEEVLTNISKGEENTSYREGVKANRTELSKEMKEIASKAYMEGGVISGRISELPMYNFSTDANSGISFYEDKDITEDVKKFKEASKELQLKNLSISEGVFEKIKTGKSLIVSNGECYKTKRLCEDALGRSVSHKEFMECLSLYADGSSKVNTEAYDKAYSTLKENVIKGVERNGDDPFVRPFLYAEDRNLITNVSKEALHIEKMAWNHAIANANDSQKELLSEMAKIKLNPYQQTHLDNKLDDIVSYSIGDMEVKFFSTKTTDLINSAAEPQVDNSTNSSIKVSISQTFESAKSTLDSVKKTSKENIEKGTNNIMGKVSGFKQRLASTRNKIARVFTPAKQSIKDVYRDFKNLPQDAKNVYNAAKTGAENAYNTAKTNAGNIYSTAKKGTKSAYNTAKTNAGNIYSTAKKGTKSAYENAKIKVGNARNYVQSGASKAWGNIRNRVGKILIQTGDKLQGVGNGVGTSITNTGANIKNTGINLSNNNTPGFTI